MNVCVSCEAYNDIRIIVCHSSFVHKAKSSWPSSPKARLVPLEALCRTQHNHFRRQTRELHSIINTNQTRITQNTHLVNEKDIGALRHGRVQRLCIMLLLARKPQIATRSDMRSLLETGTGGVCLQRVLELRKSLGSPVREHVKARKRCRG